MYPSTAVMHIKCASVLPLHASKYTIVCSTIFIYMSLVTSYFTHLFSLDRVFKQPIQYSCENTGLFLCLYWFYHDIPPHADLAFYCKCNLKSKIKASPVILEVHCGMISSSATNTRT